MTTVLPGESSEKMVWEAVACNEVMTNQEVAFWGGAQPKQQPLKLRIHTLWHVVPTLFKVRNRSQYLFILLFNPPDLCAMKQIPIIKKKKE